MENSSNQEKSSEKEKFVIDATKEAEYVVDSYTKGIYAIKAAEIVKENTNNEEIREVANRIVKTHQKIVDELDAIASAKKISLPSNLNQRQRSNLNKLIDNKAITLDKIFLNQMENEHKEDIVLFEKISKESEDNEISTLAITSLSSLKTEYDELKAIQERLEL